LIDKKLMTIKLKHVKNLNIFSDGSISLCYSGFFKDFKKLNFLEKDFKSVSMNKKNKVASKTTSFFDIK